MMNYRFFSLVILLVFFSNFYSYSQETEQDENHEEHHKKHAVSLVISHTHIRSGVKNNTGDKWISLPSFGINYNYAFNEKWALGLHTDIIVEEFIVEDKSESGNEYYAKNEEVEIPGIERSHPIAPAVMLSYKPLEHLALLAGGGMEFSKEENFALVRFGVEFPFHIPNNWEIFGALTYDINIDAYDSLAFGFGIAKLF